MVYDLRVISWQDCLHLDAEGHFDMAGTRQFFYDAIWACARSRIGRVLLDVRDATADISLTQLASLALVAREVAPPSGEHKIALLTRPEVQFTKAQFLAGKAQEEGWNITAFHSFEEAVTWLAKIGSTPWPTTPPAPPTT